jgi:hypothetical protein
MRRREEGVDYVSSLPIQAQARGNVIVHSAVRERRKKDDERENRQQERSAKEDYPVSELHIAKTLEQFLSD